MTLNEVGSTDEAIISSLQNIITRPVHKIVFMTLVYVRQLSYWLKIWKENKSKCVILSLLQDTIQISTNIHAKSTLIMHGNHI